MEGAGLVGALVGVAAEEVALGLDEGGGQARGPHAVVVGERGGERRGGHPVQRGLRDDAAGTALRLQLEDGRRKEYSFGDLAAWSSRFARFLEAEGVERGDGVAVMLELARTALNRAYGVERGLSFWEARVKVTVFTVITGTCVLAAFSSVIVMPSNSSSE